MFLISGLLFFMLFLDFSTLEIMRNMNFCNTNKTKREQTADSEKSNKGKLCGWEVQLATMFRSFYDGLVLVAYKVG